VAKVKTNNDLHDYLSSLEFDKDKYYEYAIMTVYERKIIVTTNYWRVMNGKKEIPIPPQDKHYIKYFDNRCYELTNKESVNKSFRTQIRISEFVEKTKKNAPDVKNNTDINNKVSIDVLKNKKEYIEKKPPKVEFNNDNPQPSLF
jgi:hypothetical protein